MSIETDTGSVDVDFGYGSLVWRPDFPFEERRELQFPMDGVVGFGRSTDHRGVPGAPGRVATSVEGGSCWGGFSHPLAAVDRVMTQLDYREKGGVLPTEFRLAHWVLPSTSPPQTTPLGWDDFDRRNGPHCLYRSRSQWVKLGIRRATR